MTEEEREAFWRDIGRPRDEGPEPGRVCVHGRPRYFGCDECDAAVKRLPAHLFQPGPITELDGLSPVEQWEYLVQRRLARADLHGGEQ